MPLKHVLHHFFNDFFKNVSLNAKFIDKGVSTVETQEKKQEKTTTACQRWPPRKTCREVIMRFCFPKLLIPVNGLINNSLKCCLVILKKLELHQSFCYDEKNRLQNFKIFAQISSKLTTKERIC